MFRTAQDSARFDRAAEAQELIARWADNPPAELAGAAMQAGPIEDSAGNRTDGVRLVGTSGDMGLRVIARASGTEPKAKIYLEVSAEPGADAQAVEALLERLKVDVSGAV